MGIAATNQLFLLCLCFCFEECVSVLPGYIPCLQQAGNTPRAVLIEEYFKAGLNYSEITAFLLLVHGVLLSVRQLKRILKAMGLRRRRNPSDLNNIIDALEQELRGSGNRVGYRQIHQRLTVNHGLNVDRETVRKIVKVVDPEGVEIRSRRKLTRRKYKAKGPNYIWHIDGYDKLKPFGFCIHGAIDGYSRRILWLEVGSTNNDPKVVAQYYTDAVRQVGGVPCIVRVDAGTENVNVAAVQRFLRREDGDSFAGQKSFMYGKSVSNQRIEAWWSFLRKSETSWWMDLFKDFRDSGEFSDEDPMQVECLRFCFMDLLQGELHRVATNWNLHKIRPSQNADSPSGRPDVLYFLPEISETRDYQAAVCEEDMEVAEELCCSRRPKCSDEFLEMVQIIMNEHGLTIPQNTEEATLLYTELLLFINDI